MGALTFAEYAPDIYGPDGARKVDPSLFCPKKLNDSGIFKSFVDHEIGIWVPAYINVDA
jgi:hypothetical protein